MSILQNFKLLGMVYLIDGAAGSLSWQKYRSRDGGYSIDLAFLASTLALP
jgi:hypothetical protein